MAIDFFDNVCGNVRSVCSCGCVCFCVCRFQRCVHMLFNASCAFYLHLHMWETEVKVAETKQTAFPLVTSAAAVTFCPGRLGPSPSSTNLLHFIIRPLTPGAPHPAHTTVLIRLIGLDLELPPVPVAPAPVTCGPC